MHVQVNYQNLDHSLWMEQFIVKRVERLNRYLSQPSRVQVNLKLEKSRYVTTLAIHNSHHDYAFSTEGLNLYESFSLAIEKAVRTLSEEKQKAKDRKNKSFSIQAEG
jgi:ribosomal subunit interface protein